MRDLFDVPTVDDPVLGAVLVVTAVLAILAGATLVVVIGYHWFQKRREEKRRRLRDRWEPLLLDVLAGDRPTSRLVETVDPGDRSAFIELLITYALAATGRVVDRLEQCADPFLEPERNRLAHSDPTVRALGVQVFGLLGGSERVEVVEGALEDESPTVALTAAWTLVRRCRRETYPAILREIDRFVGYGTDQLVSLCTAMGPAALPALRRLFEEEDRPLPIRTVAAEALRWMGDGGSSEAAVRVIEDAQDRELRAAALRLLRRIGRSAHADAVRPLTRHEDAVLRLHAFGALGQLGDVSDRPLLRSGFDDASPWVARRAAIALADLGLSGVLEDLAASDHPRAELADQMRPAR